MASKKIYKNEVQQSLKGASLRSFRITDTLRRANRYAVYSDRKINEVGLPGDVNELRSFLYTFSIISNDTRALLPNNFLDSLNRTNLRLGKAVGDFNAIRNTLTGKSRDFDVAGIGERAVRRVGGRISGRLMNTIIPSGNDVFSRSVFRSIRSVAGANLTIEMDRFIKGQNGKETASSKLAADFSGLVEMGENASLQVAEYIRLKVQENTPIDTGALLKSLKLRKGRKGGNTKRHTPDYTVSIGNVKPMPDPKVPYPWIVEFGINEGYGKTKIPFESVFPTPLKFRFLSSVSGPTPEDNTYYDDYSEDNRSPYDRGPGNWGKGAMVRTALWKIVKDANKYKTFSVGIPKYKTNPMKEIVWDVAQKKVDEYERSKSMRNWGVPF